MATNGIKIIDGDLAHDVYHTFIDLYDAGGALDEIKATLWQLQADNDDFADEIFITAYALALWEIGEFNAEIIQQVQQIIARGAFVRYLTEDEWCPVEGRKRQQVLDRFWTKINQPNPKIRKRKACKLQTNFVFDEGDVLAFEMPDGSYRATILLFVSQYAGQCSYEFAIPTYVEPTKLTIDNIRAGEIMGYVYAMPNFPEPRLGFNVVSIGHKHLRGIANKFERIGQLETSEAAKCCGIQSSATSFDGSALSFRDFNNFLDVKKTAKTHPDKVFPVSILL